MAADMAADMADLAAAPPALGADQARAWARLLGALDEILALHSLSRQPPPAGPVRRRDGRDEHGV